MKRNLTLIAAAAVSLLLWIMIAKGCAAVAQMPPKKFQGGTETAVLFSTEANVNFLCGTKPRKDMLQACVLDGVIIAPNPCSQPGPYAELLCHELAHTNGWGAEHPSS